MATMPPVPPPIPTMSPKKLRVIGVPLDLEIRDRTDRPIGACHGKPIAGLLA